MALLANRHIVIANNVYPPIMAGGAELIVSYLAEGLAERGHKVTVVSTCAPEMEPYPDETRNGIDVVRFFPKNLYWSFSRGERPGYQKALWHVRDAWNRDAARRFGAITEQRRPDILHTHLIDGFSAAIWRVAQSQGAKVLHTAHDYHLLCPRALMLTRDLKICRNPVLGCRMYRKWHLNTTRYVDMFASPSQFLIDQHLQAGLKAKSVKKIANGIPLPVSTESRSDPNAPFRFIFAARLTTEKGCDVVLDAVHRLPADLPVEIVVAGRGVYEDRFRVLAATDSRVRFLGYVQGEEKDELFRSGDCLLLPSLWYENAPVVIVEAAAWRMPIIGSRIGAIPEFVHDGETGLLFEPSNGADLAEKMAALATNRTMASRYGNNAHAFAERSSVAHMVDAYEAEYAGLLRRE